MITASGGLGGISKDTTLPTFSHSKVIFISSNSVSDSRTLITSCLQGSPSTFTCGVIAFLHELMIYGRYSSMARFFWGRVPNCHMLTWCKNFGNLHQNDHTTQIIKKTSVHNGKFLVDVFADNGAEYR